MQELAQAQRTIEKLQEGQPQLEALQKKAELADVGARARREETLLLVDNGADSTQREIVRRLCDGQRDIRFITAENFVGENCI